VNGHRPTATTTNGSAAATSVHPAGSENSCPVLIVQLDPVLILVLPVGDELKVAARQRVDQVRHTDMPVPIARIGCT
jgi:hypothetical protein